MSISRQAWNGHVKAFCFALFFLVFFLLNGCSTLFPRTQQPFNPNLSWKHRYHELNQMNQWNLQGSIAVHTPKKSFTAHLIWQQKSEGNYSITLFGPLGMNTVQITGSQGLFTLRTSSNQTLTAKSPEQLLFQELGWNLPLSNLYYWVRGLPAPSKQAILSWDAYHHVQTLQQARWQIRYLDYQSVGKNDLPTKITLQNDFISLRIAIHSWEVSAEMQKHG